MTINKLYEQLNKRIPQELSCEWDVDGLQVCPNGEQEVKKVLVCLDATEQMIEKAKQIGANVILTHHPILFTPLACVTEESINGKRVLDLVKNNIAVMSFHTRLDKLDGGVNDALCQALGLNNVQPFGEENLGRIGTWNGESSLKAFADAVKKILNIPAVQVVNVGKKVQKVAVIGGAGGDEIADAKKAGADTYLTGEVKHHHFAESAEAGLNLVVAGHHQTENGVCQVLAEFVKQINNDIEVELADSVSAEIY